MTPPSGEATVCPVCQEPSVCDHMGWEYEPDKKLAEVRKTMTDGEATKPQDKLTAALERLYQAMKNGDKQRQAEGKPLLWGEPEWWTR